ncbi:ABC transporter permease [Micromonospora mirobrigensis]|uniref:Monosaccharide ABC transporter membrane protein, CUT2 family (TC 3.A.1.2.-) n=1 Tax=Micromonospora mirobrigensis TaxID=262898 RepID=A0A1C4ZPX1_9ACTN|nr:ABC transporter permease [Micromonospora mirobrigensis]SCF35028.1 monosaccharide ABC transporter membrane protein, CUT2 family (TC 3.A.1.2.-) [Micromonospora mirobrigensis]
MGYDEPGRSTTAEPSSGVPAAVLENVFDDPAHGEPGRDRVGVHVVWELILLVALVTLAVLLWRRDPAALRGDGLRTLLVDMVALGLLTLAAGLSLRTAAVNLAVGPVAVAAGLHFAEQGDRGVAAATVPALLVAALGGLALALAVVVLHVPGWAASLAGAAGVIVYIERRAEPVLVQGEYDPHRTAWYLFAGFAAAAVFGGLFGAIRSVRRLVGRFRPVADPARRRGVLAGFVAGGALVGSTVLAVLAGILIAANGSGPVAPTSGLDWTVLAVGVAMLAGTSAYGRRGGIVGTLLAVCLAAVFLSWSSAQDWTISRWATGGVVLAGGLVVTRLVEAFGRPRSAREETTEPTPAGDGAISSGWTLPRPTPVESWPPVMPTQPTEPPAQWEGPRWEPGPSRWDTGDR